MDELIYEFKSMRELHDFLNIVQDCRNMVLASTDGDRLVDAKSVLGMLSLDVINNPITIYFKDNADKQFIGLWEVKNII